MRWALGVLVLGVAQVASPSPLVAQDGTETETAMARTFFDEGRAAAEAENWALAAERFRQTVALRDTPGVRYNLGVSLVELGQLLGGIENLEQATADPIYTTAARDLIAATRARLARVVVVVPADGAWRVAIDERPLPDALVGSEIPIDPGEHRFGLLDVEGAVVSTTPVMLDEGESRRVELSVAPEPAPVEAPPFDATPATVTAVAAAWSSMAGLALTIAAVWSWTDAEAGVRRYVEDPTLESLAGTNYRADRTELLGGFAAGALFAAAVLWPLTATLLQRPAVPGTEVALAIDGTGARLSLGGRW